MIGKQEIKDDESTECNSSNDAETLPQSKYYSLVGNIPKSFHSRDLRNYFSKFVEEELFDCFHFRHRPQTISINQTGAHSDGHEKHVKETLCSLVRFISETHRQSFFTKYEGKYWMDKEGNGLQGKCRIHHVQITGEELKKFSKELSPPRFMPRGNVGTCTKFFLNLIKECRLPPSLIKKLSLEFPLGRRYKKYSKMPFDYGTTVVQDFSLDNEVLTGKGHTISDLNIKTAPSCKKQPVGTNGIPAESKAEEEQCSSDEDDDRCEDWERHEALHEDVTSQERLKERLYEEKIELVWEKGGPGLVFYTDAQYWDAKEGDFDEQTADDWDVDMEGYYVAGGGDKDARDMLEMRKSSRFQNELEEVSIFRKPKPEKRRTPHLRRTIPSSTQIGKFEEYTKGIGRQIMENSGWKEGEGLGKSNDGIKEALHNEGQPPRDKRGIGYYGEQLVFGRKRLRHVDDSGAEIWEDEGPKISIGTIYDNPKDLDKAEPTLRSNDNTIFITRYKEIKR